MEKTEKDCFGVLNKVFPVGKDGLREIVPGCFDCPDRKACLQAAMTTKKGLAFRNELLARTPVVGVAARIRRWSEKKEISRLLKQKKGKQI